MIANNWIAVAWITQSFELKAASKTIFLKLALLVMKSSSIDSDLFAVLSKVTRS